MGPFFSTCHDVIAFIGIASSGPFSSFDAFSCFGGGASFGAFSFVSIVDVISMMEGCVSLSRSKAISGVGAFPHFVFTSEGSDFPHFVFFPFLFADVSNSLQLDESSIIARFPAFLSLSFCSLDACILSLLEKTFACFAASGRTAMVCVVPCTFPVFLANTGSNLDPFDLSRTKIVESHSSWKSAC